MKLLELNDGWTQIPPKKDGEYWMVYAKPWHSDNAYDFDCLILVRIKDGKRVEVMDGYDEEWRWPDCDAPDNPVWDSESQYEMLAAWRPRLSGEDFGVLPPKIKGKIFERHPAICSVCGQLAAIYRVGKAPRLCYSCGHIEMMGKDYFNRQFGNTFREALAKDK